MIKNNQYVVKVLLRMPLKMKSTKNPLLILTKIARNIALDRGIASDALEGPNLTIVTGDPDLAREGDTGRGIGGGLGPRTAEGKTAG